MIAAPKNTVAHTRRPSSIPPSESSRTANTGTRASRSMVSALGRLTSRADWGGLAAGSGATALTGRSPPGRDRSERDVRGRQGDQVDALGADHLGGQQLPGAGAVGNPGHRGRAVGVGVLVGGVAGPRART